MMRALLASLILTAAALVVPAAAHAAPASAPAPASSAVATPQQVVEEIANQLADKLDGHRAELKNNRAELIHVIDSVFLPHFDVDYASILVLGRHAREATPEQRERFAKAFYDSITHRYAEGLLNYTRGAVKVLPYRGKLNQQRAIVRTQVKLGDGKTVSVDYAFRKTRQGDWKAYDVIVEGISYITNYRNQVDAEIRKEGINALIEGLEKGGAKTLKAMDKDGAS